MKRINTVFLFLLVFTAPIFVKASVFINEIMYDLDGADTGREWIEIFNFGSGDADLLNWKLYEAGVNHKINIAGENNDFIISSGGYAVIADDPEKFLLDWPNFSGIIFDSSFSLSNVGENIILKDSDLKDIDSVSYTSEWGANGDGKSLQKINNNWQTASSTPGAQNQPNQPNRINQSNQIDQTSQINQNNQSGPSDIKRIKADAGGDKTAVVGADIEFIGRAFGLKDEPLDSARFVWNFGDGSSKEGRAVNHAYIFPGEYIAVLDVVSGEYTASHRITVKIIPNEIIISKVNPAESWIEIYNGSSEEINISFWKLKNKKQFFVFPQNTFIKAKNHLVIPQPISYFDFLSEQNEIEFLYPNNSLAGKFIYSSFSQTVARQSAANNSQESAQIQSSATPLTNTQNLIGKEVQKYDTANNQAEISGEPSKENFSEKFKSSGELNQESNVLEIAKGNSKEDDSKVGKWILIIFGIAVFSAAGFLSLKIKSN